MRIALFSQKKRLPQETQRAVAPEKLLLPLLPSGPDGVQGFSPHGAESPVKDVPSQLMYDITRRGGKSREKHNFFHVNSCAASH